MLGKAFIGRVQIDIWCGECDTFVSDAMISEVPFDTKRLSDSALADKHVLITSFSHLRDTFKLEELEYFKQILKEIKNIELTPRRITFGVNDVSRYDRLQTSLLKELR